MNLDRAARVAVAGLFALTLVALPALAHAQVGSLAGKVVGPDGKPVPDAVVTLTNVANSLTAIVKTNNNGEWVRAGLQAGNPWNIRVKKDDLEGGINNVRVAFNSVLELPPIVITKAAPPMDAATKARMEAEKVQQALIAKISVEVDAAIAAGDLDLAIAKFTEGAAALPNCAVCYVRIGDLHMKKARTEQAEQAYLKAISLDDQNADAYNALTNIYNSQRKFDEAAKMSAKFNALANSTGGGDNAESLFNQGAIAFNQNKIAEAKPFLAEGHCTEAGLGRGALSVRHGADQRRQGSRGQEVAGRVPEACSDRPERRDGEGHHRHTVAMAPPEGVAGIAEHLEAVRRRIIAAAQRAGRSPSDITLIAVSKTVEPGSRARGGRGRAALVRRESRPGRDLKSRGLARPATRVAFDRPPAIEQSQARGRVVRVDSIRRQHRAAPAARSRRGRSRSSSVHPRSGRPRSRDDKARGR